MAVLPAALRVLLILVASWQALVWAFDLPRYILPAPLDVVQAFRSRSFYLLDHTLVTLGEVAAGFVAGTLLGIATALAVVALPRLGRIVWPLILVTQAFPVFVIAPVLVLWFGFGMASKVVMTTLIIFFRSPLPSPTGCAGPTPRYWTPPRRRMPAAGGRLCI